MVLNNGALGSLNGTRPHPPISPRTFFWVSTPAPHLSVYWPIHMYDMTHLRVWHGTDSCCFVTKKACVCYDSSTWMTWLIQMCDMTHPHVWHDSSTCTTWLIHLCDMARILLLCYPRLVCVIWLTHAYVWYDSLTRTTWLIHMCEMTHSHVCHDSCICAAWLTHMHDMTHPHMRDDSCTCVPWLMHMCAMTHAHVCHDSCTCVPWLMNMCAMTHEHVCHDSCIGVTRLTQSVESSITRISVTWLIHMCAMTNPRVWHGTDLTAFAWYRARIELLCTNDTRCCSMGVCLQGSRCLNAGWRRLVSSMQSHRKLIDGEQLHVAEGYHSHTEISSDFITNSIIQCYTRVRERVWWYLR